LSLAKLTDVCLQSEPYVRMVRGTRGRELEGFLPDLISILSKRLGFEYELRLIHPPVHGYYDNVTDSWTGLIGEVIKREVGGN